MSNNSYITWLHLSDLHKTIEAKQHDWWPSIQEIFFNDLSQQLKVAECSHLDLILVTGDLTRHGTVEEFKQVSVFFNLLLEKLNMMGHFPLLLSIPGNHDINHPDIEKQLELKPLIHDLSCWHIDETVRIDFWNNSNSDYRKLLDQVFTPYKNWWQQQTAIPKNLQTGLLPGDFSVSLDIKGIKLGIVGLNTAFLQVATENEAPGKSTVHTRQFNAVCQGNGASWVKQHHACLLMTHHPHTFLSKVEGSIHLKGDIWGRGNNFALHLCGHLHSETHHDISGNKQLIWQASSFAGLMHVGQLEHPRLLGYALGQLRFTVENNKGVLLHWPRKIKVAGEQRRVVVDTDFDLAGDNTFPKQFKLLQPYLGQTSQQQSILNTLETKSIDKYQYSPEKPDAEKQAEKKTVSSYSVDIEEKEIPSVSQSIFEKHDFEKKLTHPIEIFISYCRKDKEFLEQLLLQFSWLKRQKHISFYFDEGNIHAGERYEDSIKQHIKIAPVILLLLSPDFFASSYCMEEMEDALKREQINDALVIPVYLRKMQGLKEMDVAKLQILPDLDTPLASEKFMATPDEGFAIVAEGVVKAIKKSLDLLKKVLQSCENIDWEPMSYTILKDEKPVKISYSISKEPMTVEKLNQLIGLKLDTLDFYLAKNYAEKLGARLATEEEWRYCYQKNKILTLPKHPEWLYSPENEEAEFQDLMNVERIKGRLKAYTLNQHVDEGRENYAFRLVKEEA